MKHLIFYSLLLAMPKFFSEAMSSIEHGVNGSNTVTIGKRLTLESFVITKEKDVTINGRDAVSFVAMQYSSCATSHTPLALQDIKKVKKQDLNKTQYVNRDITQNFLAGQKVAFTLYERDLCNCQQSWNYECNKNMYYTSRTAGYGSVIINFSDFSSIGSSRTYILPEGSITVKLQ